MYGVIVNNVWTGLIGLLAQDYARPKNRNIHIQTFEERQFYISKTEIWKTIIRGMRFGS